MRTTLNIAVALALGSLLFPAEAQTKQSLKNQRINLRLGVRSADLPLSASTQSSAGSRPAATSNSKQFVFDGVPIKHNGNEKWKNAIVTVLTYMKENDPDAYKAHKKYTHKIEYKKEGSSKHGAPAWAHLLGGGKGGSWFMKEAMLEHINGDGTSISHVTDYFFATVYHESQHCDMSNMHAKRPAKSYEEPAAAWASYHYLKRAGKPSIANWFKGMAASKGFTKEMWDAYKKDLN